MNASIISNSIVTGSALDALAAKLPAIFSEILDVPGGNLARLRPEQVSLEFSQASTRDVGSDIRIMIYARKNDPRIHTENRLAKAILDKVIALMNQEERQYSIDVRLYLMDIGASEYVPTN